MTTTGWYVHHHGHGHRTRFLAVRPHLDADVVAFSTLPAPAGLPPRTEWVRLPRDDDGEIAGDVTAGGLLHWAPVGHPGHRERLATIARVAVERRLDALVVDVSAEVALFGRLLGLPVVVFAQPGDRTDAPHGLAYRVAERIVAPWPAGIVPVSGFATDDPRVAYVGGISRFAARERSESPIPGTVFVLGGTPIHAGPDWSVVAPERWVDDPWTALCRAEIVVSAAGQNAVADLAAGGARAVIVPQQRPFGEQAATGAVLADWGLAVVAERVDDAALSAARDLRPAWGVWGVRGAAARAAAAIAGAMG